MNITLSINKTCVGKDPYTIGNDRWITARFSIREMLLWTYEHGYAIAPGVFDDSPLQAGEKTQKVDDRWQQSELIIVDIDEFPDDGWSIQRLLDNPFVKQYCVAAYPSSSYSPDVPKLHLCFVPDRTVTMTSVYRALADYCADQFPIKADSALMKPSQGVYGTVFNKDGMQGHIKSIDDNLCYYNPDAEPINVTGIMQDIIRKRGGLELDNHDKARHQAHNDAHDPFVSQRAEEHAQQPYPIQKRVTLDALSYALKGWGELRYNDRLPLIMAAYAGCNAPEVKDMFLANQGDAWQDSNQRREFDEWWSKHEVKEGGYTVATLFYKARQNGWLQHTNVELQDYNEFHAEDVGDWLLNKNVLPRRALIKSGTGSGKTRGAIRVLKQIGVPKSIFFAPSIKLCESLSATLHQMGVDNTLYIEDGKTLSGDVLRDANVLVTTLQTFAMKVHRAGVNMSDYKLAVIDESDDLISSFVRANTGSTLGYSSHVSDDQSQRGIATLYDLCQQVEHVLFLDGTATQVSQQLLTEFSPPDSVETWVNTWTRDKTDVTLLPSLHAARQTAHDAVQAGQKVVIACDTKRECRSLEQFLLMTQAATHDEIITITSDTHHKQEVREFFRDVEIGAQKFRVVIYNSAMGSGVSITETVPDTFVQIATHVSPRKNLQMLNRYRRQNKVYAYITPTETLYNESASEKMRRIEDTIQTEQTLTGLDMSERSFLAGVHKDLAILAVQDEFEQIRCRLDFYTRLLKDDGREVSLSERTASETFKASFDKVHEHLKTQKEAAFKYWRQVRPITRENPADSDMTSLEVAQGVIHATIDKVAHKHDEIDHGLTDEELSTLVWKFKSNSYMIDRFMNPDNGLFQSIQDLHVSDRSTVTFRLYVARLEMLHLLDMLFDYPDYQISDDELQTRANDFIQQIRLRQNVYDTLVGRSRNHFLKIMQRYDTPEEQAIALAKYIVKAIGLTIKRKNGSRREDGSRQRVSYIDGIEELLTFLKLRGYENRRIEFSREQYNQFSDRAIQVSAQFDMLPSKQKGYVIDNMKWFDYSYDGSVGFSSKNVFS